MSKEVIVTGIRANSDLTIGNYFGAILPMIDMAKSRADKYQINLFVPDLHSFTTPVDHTKLQRQIMHALRVFVAAGLPLGSDDIHIYRQSFVPAHSELTWILSCFTGFGEMWRMTQFKDKSGTLQIEREQGKIVKQLFLDNYSVLADFKGDQVSRVLTPEETQAILSKGNTLSLFFRWMALEQQKGLIDDKVTAGLFNYPVLMATDILLYGASYVPVGEDQTQHLEFARDIAERMNNQFGQLFVVPKPVKEQHALFGNDQGLRIKDLSDPTKKMSKSDETGKGVVYLGDKPEEAAKKVMSATTDSEGAIHFDWDKQPGITNLLQILSLLTGKSQDEVNREWTGRSNYGELKQAVSETVSEFLSSLQSKLSSVDDSAVKAKLERSEAAMNEMANATLLKVQEALGLRP